MKSLPVLVGVLLLGGGCDVEGGNLTGAGGGAGSSGAGGGIMTGSGGSGLGGAGGGTDPADWCGRDYPVSVQPPDIVAVIDTSASMNDAFDGPCPGGCAASKWSAARAVLESAVTADSPDASWGLQLFTDGGADACATGGVTVPVGEATATAIRSELARRSLGADLLTSPGNRPTRTAIRSAMSHLVARNNPGYKAILLITDGVPNCAASASNPLAGDAAGAIREISSANSSNVRTFVAGMAIAAGAEATLSEMAHAGGLARADSPAYYPVSSSAELAAAVDALLAQVARCTFALPPLPSNDGTSSRGNIAVRLDGRDVPHDAQDGWMYVDDTLTAFQFHGSACDAARAGGAVSISFLCLLP